LTNYAKSLNSKGWEVYFNDTKYGLYDITSKSGYIPNASNWNENVYKSYNLTITRITNDGKMMNDE
jgi:hypothetical protein